MDIALVTFKNIDISNIVETLKPKIILTANKAKKDNQLAEIALQLDEKILFENINIDLVVCVINDLNIDLEEISSYDHNDYLDTIYYTNFDLHASSFFCKPNVFSAISNLYKIDFQDYGFSNTTNDTTELLHEKIFWLINRLGIEIKIVKSQ
jgi:hypothetical protein